MQRIRLLIAVVCLALVVIPASGYISIAQAQETQTSDGLFPTPEDAIAAFFEGVTEGDLAKILQTSAIDEISENFEFELYVERLRAFMPMLSPAPADYPLYVEINRAELAARMSNQVKILAYSLLAGDDIEFDRTMMMELEGARDFLLQVDPSRLTALEVIEVSLPAPTVMNSPRYQENALNLAAPYGADDSTERVALLSFEQNHYVLGFSLLQYGDHWKINSLSSPIAGTSATGAAELITPEDFADLTS